jgi:GMP synthase (glutamine-hydrolysing)
VRVLSIVHQRDAGAGVFAEAAAQRGDAVETWMPPEAPPPALDGYGAVLVFGGAMHVDQEVANPWLRPEKRLLRSLLERGTPVLGVCLGSQLLAEAAGGEARRAARPEIGWHEIELAPDASSDPLLGPLPKRFEGFQWHSYEFTLPPGGTALARSAVCLQAYRVEGSDSGRPPAWGIQFHAEVSRESVNRWLADYREDPDAVRIEIDPERLRAESETKIGAWNELGRGICTRFLEQASEREALPR